MVRVLVCGYATVYLVLRSPHIWSTGDLGAERWDPVGVVSALGLQPLSRPVLAALLVAAVVAGLAATTGCRFSVSGPAFAGLTLLLLTYRLSWGQVLHTENLLVFHLIVVGCTPAARCCSLDARRSDRRGMPPDRPATSYRGALRLMSALTALSYLLAAVAKARNGGLAWVSGDVLRNQVAYDNLRKHLLGDPHSPLGGWLTRFAWVFVAMALATVLIEWAAPLIGARWTVARWWIGAAWAFHVGVLAVMAIVFPYQLSGIAYSSALPLERWVRWGRSATSVGGAQARASGPSLQ